MKGFLKVLLVLGIVGVILAIVKRVLLDEDDCPDIDDEIDTDDEIE